MDDLLVKLKKFRVLIIVLVVLLAAVSISLILRRSLKETPVAETQEPIGYFTDTDHPVYLTSSETELSLRLESHAEDDLAWEVSCDLDNKVMIQNDEGSNGELVSVIKPGSAGYATISYTRSGEIAGVPYTSVSIDVDVIVSEDEEKLLTIQLSDIRQNVSDSGALDTDSPFILSGDRVILPKGGDWTLEPYDQENVPEGLYQIGHGVGDNGIPFYVVSMDTSVMVSDDGSISEKAMDSVLVLKSEQLGIEKKLKCRMDPTRSWVLYVVED